MNDKDDETQAAVQALLDENEVDALTPEEVLAAADEIRVATTVEEVMAVVERMVTKSAEAMYRRIELDVRASDRGPEHVEATLERIREQVRTFRREMIAEYSAAYVAAWQKERDHG